jgi:integrase
VTQSAQAFLSYDKEDSKFALPLAEDLKAAGANVWLDQLDIPPGVGRSRLIDSAFASSPRVLVILNSMPFLYCVDRALKERKTVIPVMYKDCVIPYNLRELRGVQYVDFRKDYARGLQDLLEVAQIVDAAKGQYRMLFKLAAETGARAGELYALTVDDILFAHNVVRVNKSMYDQKVGSPKCRNASRWINLKPYVMQMLKEHLKGRTTGLVFQSRRRTPLQNCTVLHKHLHPLQRQLGIEQGGMHAFRHHRVSTLVMAGTPLVVIRKWVGHGREQMVERYTHLRPDFMRDELARVPDFVPKTGQFDPFDPKQAAVA